jgi:hypothetical protein
MSNAYGMESSVELDSEELLPSGRICRRIMTPHNSPAETPAVYVGTGGRLCCRHGETHQWITESWSINPDNPLSNTNITKAVERNRARTTDRVKSRCDCTKLDGLLTHYNISPSDWPTAPKDRGELFRFLYSTPTAERRTINGRVQVHACTWEGINKHPGCSVWVRKDGAYVCEHGNTENKLKKCQVKRKKGKPSRADCGCVISILKRKGSALSVPLKRKRPRGSDSETEG